MRAMILAAGRGERMRPLTDHTPKPLLQVQGVALIDHHLSKLAQAGFTQVLINLAYLGHLIRAHCGNGERYGLAISYSEEGPEPLETGGALNHCLAWFDAQPFAMVSADVYSSLDYRLLADATGQLAHRDLQAELVLTHNPEHHPDGDFGLKQGRLSRSQTPRFTYTGLGCAKPSLIDQFPGRQLRFPLRDALNYWLERGKVGGQLFAGQWTDVGTPARLAALQSP